MRPTIGALAALVVLALAVPARAAGPRVAPLAPRITPPVSAEITERFHGVLAESLARLPGVSVIAPAVVQYEIVEPQLRSCAAAACRARIAQHLGATYLVIAEMHLVGKAYAITVRVYDERGAELAKVARSCEICTRTEAEDTLRLATAGLGRVLTPAAPPPAPASQPPPPTSRPASGPWATPKPPEPPAPKGPTLWERMHGWNWRLIGLVSAGVAALGLSVGIPLLAYDGKPTCDLPDGRRTCPDVYATGAGGGLFTTIGVLAAAAAGTSFYLNWHFGRTHVEVAPQGGRGSAGVSARWSW